VLTAGRYAHRIARAMPLTSRRIAAALLRQRAPR
jgi:hypothetical protein